MDSEILDRLESEIRLEFETKMEAIRVLRGTIGNTTAAARGRSISPPSEDPQVQAQREKMRRYRERRKEAGVTMTDDERKKKVEYHREYQRRWRKNRRKPTAGQPEKQDGLPASEFKKFLHKGPISEGGTGEED